MYLLAANTRDYHEWTHATISSDCINLSRSLWQHANQSQHSMTQAINSNQSEHSMDSIKAQHNTTSPHFIVVCINVYKDTYLHIYFLKYFTKHHLTKMHSCKICLATFTQRWILMRHIRTVHGEPQYRCSLCDTTFTRIERYNAHLKKPG